MLPETQRTLHSFYQLNHKYYSDARREFKPKLNGVTGEYDTPYGAFPEMEEIYRVFYSLELTIEGDLFRSDYEFAFAHPKEITKELSTLKSYLESHLERLIELKQKYFEEENYPVIYTYNMYLKAFEAIEYVTGLDEVIQITQQNEIEYLKNENIDLKFNEAYKSYLLKLKIKFFIYLLLILLPVIVVCFSNSNWKWYSLLSFLLPYLDGFFSRENFVETIRIIVGKTYRNKFKDVKKEKFLKGLDL